MMTGMIPVVVRGVRVMVRQGTGTSLRSGSEVIV